MLRARCFRLITYSIRVYYNQIMEIALSFITKSGFVHTIYRDLGNLGEYIKFSVTVFIPPKKYPKIIETIFFFFITSTS